MTINELKQQKVESLRSTDSSIVRQGHVYNDLAFMVDLYSGDYLSDEQLLSSLAQKLKETYLISYKASGDVECMKQAAICNKFILHNSISKSALKTWLTTMGLFDADWNVIKNKLKDEDFYKKVDPTLLKEILRGE